MQKRVSIGDVARAAGLHHSTASRALSNHPHIAAATRERVRALAERLGYRPEPALAAMARDRWLGRASSGNANVLAYIVEERRGAVRELHYRGACRAAERLGFRLEMLARAEHPDDRSLARVLLARGIQGLVLRSARPGWRRLELPWDKFAAVHLGLPPDLPPWLDGTMVDTFGLHRRAMTEVLARGYRRPALVLLEPRYLADEVLRIGGALAAWSEAGRSDPVPPHYWLNPVASSGPEREALVAWLRRQGTDVVLGQTDTILGYLREAGLRCPQDLGYLSLSEGREPAVCRALPDVEGIGAKAVEMVAAALHQRRYGLPAKPVLAQVPGDWLEGGTLSGERACQRLGQ